MRLTVIPSIDLRDGKVVRLQQGDFARQLDYALDPLDAARAFAAAGATLMHVVDLDGARLGRVAQPELIARIARVAADARLRVQAGGGVRSREDVAALLAAGVDRVVLGTKAIEDWPWFEALAHEPTFDDKLVLAVDAKDGRIAVRGWTRTSVLTAIDIARTVRGWPLAGLLYTDVARDGMLGGANVETTALLAVATDVPVIASGGIGTLEHVAALRGRGIWGVVLGRSLHDGRIALAEAIATAGGDGPAVPTPGEST